MVETVFCVLEADIKRTLLSLSIKFSDVFETFKRSSDMSIQSFLNEFEKRLFQTNWDKAFKSGLRKI